MNHSENIAADFLGRYRLIDCSINNKLSETEHWRDIATRISPAAQFDDTGHCPSDKVGSAVTKIIDLEHKIDSEIDELIKTREEITAVLRKVESERYRTLLEMRYISNSNMTWEQIAEKMNREVRTVHRWHGNSLKIIEKILKCH